MSVNPYAIPEARLDANPSSTQGCYRVGRDVVFVTRHSDLPHRCVKCNAPSQRPTKLRSFYWHHAAWYLLILVGILIYAIAALIARKKAEVSPGLCDVHARKRTNRIWLAWGLFVGSFACIFIGARFDTPVGFLLFFLGLVACIIVAFGTRIIYPVHIDERGARFKGCGPAFLASLESSRIY